MARGVVCIGVPVDLVEQKYILQNGDHKGEERLTLRFRLDHPSTRVIGSVDLEAKSEANIKAVSEAFADSRSVEVVAQPKVIRSDKTDDYGRHRDFAVLIAASVV